MGMNRWDNERIRRFRGHILELLCSRHRQQMHRFRDSELTLMLQRLAVPCEINDVVTCLQDMGDRDWVKYRQEYVQSVDRTELTQIEIRPSGRDICEQTTTHPAVDFGRG